MVMGLKVNSEDERRDLMHELIASGIYEWNLKVNSAKFRFAPMNNIRLQLVMLRNETHGKCGFPSVMVLSRTGAKLSRRVPT